MSDVAVSFGSAPGIGADTLRLLAVVAGGGRPDGSAEQFIALCAAVGQGLLDVSVSRAGLVALLGSRVSGSVDSRDVAAALELLDVPALRVLAVVRDATRREGGWSRGVSGLARVLGLGVSTVRSALHDVLDVGLVVERTPHGRVGVGGWSAFVVCVAFGFGGFAVGRVGRACESVWGCGPVCFGLRPFFVCVCGYVPHLTLTPLGV